MIMDTIMITVGSEITFSDTHQYAGISGRVVKLTKTQDGLIRPVAQIKVEGKSIDVTINSINDLRLLISNDISEIDTERPFEKESNHADPLTVGNLRDILNNMGPEMDSYRISFDSGYGRTVLGDFTIYHDVKAISIND
jgi:hypothetical protein